MARMGTYVDALFGHGGDAHRAIEIARSLVEQDGFEIQPDALGVPELTIASLKRRWEHASIVCRRLLLKSRRRLLRMYPRGGSLYHGDVRWWAFASNGTMDSGLGREEVRTRSRAMARRFRSDRILYVPDSIGQNRLHEGVGIEEEEVFLFGLRPPLDWDHQNHEAEVYMESWFCELLDEPRDA